MKILKIEGYRPPSFKKTTIPDPMFEDSPNLIKDLETTGVESVWVADITYIRSKEGWVYLCVVMDRHSRKIVGWSVGKNMKVELVLKAFDMAHKQRVSDSTTIFHSDKGGQYKAKKFRRRLARLGYRQSMTGVDHCYDNANAESFFGTLKTELIRGKTFATRDEAEMALHEYIEVFYNRARLHSSLGYQAPEEFEKIS